MYCETVLLFFYRITTFLTKIRMFDKLIKKKITNKKTSCNFFFNSLSKALLKLI